MQNRLKVLLDANVLFSNQQRNLLLQLAEKEVFRVGWTERIEAEWLAKLEEPTRKRVKSRTLPLIRKFFPDVLLTVEYGKMGPVGGPTPKISTSPRPLFPSPRVG